MEKKVVLDDWETKQNQYNEQRKIRRNDTESKSQDIFKKHNIEEVCFEFYCGGDSMGDTTLMAVDYNGNNVDINIDDCQTLEDLIYDNVEFYDASDGHYMGESGKVILKLDLEESDFEYMKESESEYCERYGGKAIVEITENEYNFIDKFVSNINYSPWDSEQINYKTDFILTDEYESLQKSIFDKIFDTCNNAEFEKPLEAELNDEGLSYGTGNEIDDIENLKLSKETNGDITKYYLNVVFEQECTEYRESINY